MAEHTPGPWVLDPLRDGWQLLANGRNVTADPFDCSDEDARLIASAPELLAALKVAVKVMRDNDLDESMAGEFEIFTDAINKAEGRGGK